VGNRTAAWLAFILFAAFAVRSIEALNRPLEVDEYTSLYIASLPWHAMQAFLLTDAHPPAFFAFLAAIHAWYVPFWVPRLAMVVFATTSVGLLFATVRLWATELAALVAAACAAFMPSLVYYDTWIRMYAPFYFTVLLALFTLSLILKRNDLGVAARRVLWLTWTLSNVLCVYTLYLGWFFVAVQVLFVLALRRDALPKACAGTVACALAWMPQLRAFLHQYGAGGNNLRYFAGHEVSTILSLPGQATLVPQLEGWPSVAGAIVAWIWLAIAFWLAVRTQPRSLLLWLVAQPVLLVGFCLLAHKVIFLDRYYLMFAYAAAAWTGCAVSSSASRLAKPVWIGLAACFAALAAMGSAFAADPDFYTADWPAVIGQLEADSQPGDFILIESGMGSWAVFRSQELARHPRFMVWFSQNIAQAYTTAKKYPRVWFIAYQARGADPNLELLADLERDYHLKEFRLYRRALPAEDVSVGLFVR
jgi:hypothetical protein